MFARKTAISKDAVIAALRDVMDPELHRSIVELNMVKDVDVRDGSVRVEALLTISGCPMRETIIDSIKDKVKALPGVTDVDVQLGVMTQEQRQALIAQLRPGPQKQSPLLSDLHDTGPGDCQRQGRGRQVHGHDEPGCRVLAAQADRGDRRRRRLRV